MTTLDMEIAVMMHVGIRANLCVPNVSWGIHGLHECDVLALTKSGYATEYEIKVSKSDLKADMKKSHGHDHPYIVALFYVVPMKLKVFALSIIPETSGLIVVEKLKSYNFPWREQRYSAIQERSAVRRKNAIKWSDGDRYDLARLGTLRILGLKTKIAELRDKNQIELNIK